jgi:predicted GTPase
MVKVQNQAIAALRATEEDRKKYPLINWTYLDKVKIRKAKQRTPDQNDSLHLFCTQVADALNDSGYDVQEVIKHQMDVPWNMFLVKELIWRRPQEKYLGKKSTTKLSVNEVTKIYDIVNRYLSRFGIHVPFPSEEEMIRQAEMETSYPLAGRKSIKN